VAAVKERGYEPWAYYDRDAELREVLATVATYDKEIVDDLLHRDEYLTLADYRAYVDCQDEVARAWQDREQWTRSSILNTARSGFFSADRTVREYCRDIWHVTPLHPDH
jgi:starch phosphorylase